MAKTKVTKRNYIIENWLLVAICFAIFNFGLFIVYDSVSPRSDDWCRGLRKGYYAGSQDRKRNLSHEYDVQVGFERDYLGASDKLYMSRSDFKSGYKRGYQQGFYYTDDKKTQHLDDATRCDPNYKYFGMKRGYSY